MGVHFQQGDEGSLYKEETSEQRRQWTGERALWAGSTASAKALSWEPGQPTQEQPVC